MRRHDKTILTIWTWLFWLYSVPRVLVEKDPKWEMFGKVKLASGRKIWKRAVCIDETFILVLSGRGASRAMPAGLLVALFLSHRWLLVAFLTSNPLWEFLLTLSTLSPTALCFIFWMFASASPFLSLTTWLKTFWQSPPAKTRWLHPGSQNKHALDHLLGWLSKPIFLSRLS